MNESTRREGWDAFFCGANGIVDFSAAAGSEWCKSEAGRPKAGRVTLGGVRSFPCSCAPEPVPKGTIRYWDQCRGCKSG